MAGKSSKKNSNQKPRRPARAGRKGKPEGPVRAGEGADSLETIKAQAAGLVLRAAVLGPEARRLLTPSSKGDAPAGRLGLSRAETLDMVVDISANLGANRSYGKILRGAADVLGLRGVDAVDISDILEAADVSRFTYYQFFGSKEDVMVALFDLILSVWESLLADTLSAGGPPEKRLRRVLRTVIGAFSIAGYLVRVLVTEAWRPGSPLAPRMNEFRDRTVERLLPVYAEATGREADPFLVRTQMMAIIAVALDFELNPESSQQEMQQAEQYMGRLITALGRRRDD